MFALALVVVIIGTFVLDPSRLLLLLVPLSFLLAAYAAGVLFDRATGSRLPHLIVSLPILKIATNVGTGAALLGLLTTLLGLWGYYRLAGIAIGGLLLVAIVDFCRTAHPVPRFAMTWASTGSGIVIGGVWFIAWLWATIPPAFYDELVYHLPIPQHALRTGYIPALPWSFFTFMPHVSDLLLGWGIFLRGDLGARAMHFAFWLATWLAAWAFVEAAIAPLQVGWLGFALAGTLGSCSTFFFLGTLPFAETALSFAVVAAAALLVLPQTGQPPWLAVGLLWGLAATVKLSGLSWVLAETMAAIVLGWSFRHLLSAWLISSILILPWWGRAWILTGNPIYPLGYRWFGGRYWNDDSQSKLRADLPSIGDHPSVMDLIRLPYEMVTSPERFGSASDAGMLAVAGICVAIALPMWIFLTTTDAISRRRSLAGCAFMLTAVAGWIATSTTTRFLSPALIVGLALLVVLLVRLPNSLQLAGLVSFAIFGLWGTSRFIMQHSQVFASEQVALGRESPAAYLTRVVDHYESALYVRDKVPPDVKILFLGETRPYYFNRPTIAPYPFNEHPVARWILESQSPEQLRDRIRVEGITHVVLNTREFKRIHDTYKVLNFMGPDEEALDRTLKGLPHLLIPLFVKNNVFVFQVPQDIPRNQSFP